MKASLLFFCFVCLPICESSKEKEGIQSPRIIGGSDAEEGRYPYIGTLDRDPPEEHWPTIINNLGKFPTEDGVIGVTICGASLIAPDVILSAAHCGDNYGKKVRLGLHNATWDEQQDYEELWIDREIWHPAYNGVVWEGADIKVAKLRGRSNHTFVRLNQDPSIPNNEKGLLTVIGFGRRDPSDAFSSLGILQVGGGYYVDWETCKDTYSPGTVLPDTICVNYTTGRQCRGDSGSPLLIKGQNISEDLQIGLVSYGRRGCSPLSPSVSVRVSSYFDWIANQVCQLSDDPPAYFRCGERDSSSDETAAIVGNNAIVDLTDSENTCEGINVTLVIETDSYAHETGWKAFQMNSSTGSFVVRAEMPTSTNRINATVRAKFLLNDLASFGISVSDSLNDGIGGGPWNSGSRFLGLYASVGGRQLSLVRENARGFWAERQYYFVSFNSTTINPFESLFCSVEVQAFWMQDAFVELTRLDTINRPETIFTLTSDDVKEQFPQPASNHVRQRLLVAVRNLNLQGLYQLSTSPLKETTFNDGEGLIKIDALNVTSIAFEAKGSTYIHQATFIPALSLSTDIGSVLNTFEAREEEDHLILTIGWTVASSSVPLSWVLLARNQQAESSLVGYGPPLDIGGLNESFIQHKLRVPSGISGRTEFTFYVSRGGQTLTYFLAYSNATVSSSGGTVYSRDSIARFSLDLPNVTTSSQLPQNHSPGLPTFAPSAKSPCIHESAQGGNENTPGSNRTLPKTNETKSASSDSYCIHLATFSFLVAITSILIL